MWLNVKSIIFFIGKKYFLKYTEITREGFLRKNIVAVWFFKTVLYTNILNTCTSCTYLFHQMKSFKHEHLFYLHSIIHVQSTYIVTSTAQTDLGLRSRTFSKKINKLITFSEITQAWQCLEIVFIRSDDFTYWISTSNDVLNLRYRPHYSKYKDLYYTQQNHWTVTS